MKQRPLNSEEMLAYARTKGKTIGDSVPIGTTKYLMIHDETGRTYMENLGQVQTKAA